MRLLWRLHRRLLWGLHKRLQEDITMAATQKTTESKIIAAVFNKEDELKLVEFLKDN